MKTTRDYVIKITSTFAPFTNPFNTTLIHFTSAEDPLHAMAMNGGTATASASSFILIILYTYRRLEFRALR
jgi:hypothetical protein